MKRGKDEKRSKVNREHLEWLYKQVTQSAKTCLEELEQLKLISIDSEEHGDVEGNLQAHLAQLEFDIKDARAEHDAWLDSLPEEELHA